MTCARGKRPHRFPSRERLRTDREFREVVRKGSRVNTPHFTVYRDALGGRRRQVGVSAGKRVGGAVTRNRLKRLVREFYRLHKGVFPEGTRTAIVVRQAPQRAALAGVRAELLPALLHRWGGNGGSDPCGHGRSSSAS